MHGTIPDALQQRALATIEQFLFVASRMQAVRAHVVGTAALRDPRSEDLVSRIQSLLHSRMQNEMILLTEAEEAASAYRGARAAVGRSEGLGLVIDLGGGSLEFAVGNAEEPIWTASLPLGASVLSRGFEDLTTTGDIAALTTRIDKTLARAVREIAELAPQEAIYVGGTARSLARISAAHRGQWLPRSVNLAPLTRKDLVEVNGLLNPSDLKMRRLVAGVKSRRADHIHIAALILSRVASLIGLDRAAVSAWGLREGILLQESVGATIGTSEDLQRQEVERLERTYSPDRRHAGHVAEAVLRLFDATVGIHHLDASDRALLEHSARLHGIGASLSLRRDQDHGAYLVEHAEMRGFSPRELAIIMTLIRFHPSHNISRHFKAHAALTAQDRKRALTLLCLLQIADGLDVTHDQSVRLQSARLRGKSLQLTIGSDTACEPTYLQAVKQRSELASEVLGMRVEFSIR